MMRETKSPECIVMSTAHSKSRSIALSVPPPPHATLTPSPECDPKGGAPTLLKSPSEKQMSAHATKSAEAWSFCSRIPPLLASWFSFSSYSCSGAADSEPVFLVMAALSLSADVIADSAICLPFSCFNEVSQFLLHA